MAWCKCFSVSSLLHVASYFKWLHNVVLVLTEQHHSTACGFTLGQEQHGAAAAGQQGQHFWKDPSQCFTHVFLFCVCYFLLKGPVSFHIRLCLVFVTNHWLVLCQCLILFDPYEYHMDLCNESWDWFAECWDWSAQCQYTVTGWDRKFDLQVLSQWGRTFTCLSRSVSEINWHVAGT